MVRFVVLFRVLSDIHEKKSVPWRTLGDLRFSWYAGKCAREIKKKVISHGTRRTLKRTLKRTFCYLRDPIQEKFMVRVP